MKILLMTLFLAAGGLHAVTLTATDSGFVTEMGGSAKGDGTVVPTAKYNYSVGREVHYADGSLGSSLAIMDRKNYFVFDLTSVTAPIVSATLTLYTGSFESIDPTETYGLKETTDPMMALSLASTIKTGTLPAAFDDPSDPLVMDADMLYSLLGDGPGFLGGVVVSSADDFGYVDIVFTPFGISYLNSFLGSPLILAGVVATVSGTGSPQQPFGFTGPDIPGGDPTTPTLSLSTVPEPGAALYVAAAVAAAGCIRRRRSRR